jgi:hypothetical protein
VDHVGQESRQRTLDLLVAPGRDPHLRVAGKRPRRDRDDFRAAHAGRLPGWVVGSDDLGLDSTFGQVIENAEHGMNHAVGLRQERFADDRNLHAASVTVVLCGLADVPLRVAKRQVNSRHTRSLSV